MKTANETTKRIVIPEDKVILLNSGFLQKSKKPPQIWEILLCGAWSISGISGKAMLLNIVFKIKVFEWQ